MRKESLEFFRDLPEKKNEQYNKACELYRKSSGHNARLIVSLNQRGFSNQNLESVFHELKKLHGISDKEIKLAPVVIEVVAESIDISTSLSKNEAFSKLKEDESPKGPETPLEVFTLAPDPVKTEIKLRDEFPFLKDVDCPNELKILVADKFNYYDAYLTAHNALLVLVPEEGEEPVAMSPEEILTLAKAAVANFIINQDIYKELVHYKTTGKILGKHPLLVELKKEQLINEMSVAQLSNKAGLLVNYINRKKAEIAETVDPERILTLQAKIDGWEKEQQLVKARLNSINV